LKDLEGFRASVYARAEARRAQIRARNRKIQGAALGAAMVALVMSVMVPAVRGRRVFVGTATEQPIVMQDHSNAPMSQQQKEAPPSRMVLLMGVPGGGEAEVVVLDSSAKQIAFVDKYRADNNMPAEEDPVLTPVPDSAARALHSTEELKAFLQSLPKTNDSMKQVISEYDDEFFASNDLCVMPLDIMPAAVGAQEITQPGGDGVTEPYRDETEPETNPGVNPEIDGSEAGMAEENMDPSRPPLPSDPAEGTLPENGVQMLLLVPTNKMQ